MISFRLVRPAFVVAAAASVVLLLLVASARTAQAQSGHKLLGGPTGIVKSATGGRDAVCPPSQIVFPPSVVTARENARS